MLFRGGGNGGGGRPFFGSQVRGGDRICPGGTALADTLRLVRISRQPALRALQDVACLHRLMEGMSPLRCSLRLAAMHRMQRVRPRAHGPWRASLRSLRFRSDVRRCRCPDRAPFQGCGGARAGFAYRVHGGLRHPSWLAAFGRCAHLRACYRCRPSSARFRPLRAFRKGVRASSGPALRGPARARPCKGSAQVGPFGQAGKRKGALRGPGCLRGEGGDPCRRRADHGGDLAFRLGIVETRGCAIGPMCKLRPCVLTR